MPTPIERGRRFDDKQVSRILERAALLQHSEPPGAAEGEPAGMTLGELEQVAAEAGIDPQHIRAAAAAIENDVLVTGWLAVLGAPTRVALERTVDRTVASTEYESLANTIREALANPGYVSTLGKGLEWHSAHPQRAVWVTVTPRAGGAGGTTIRIEERFGNLAGGLFGGIVGGVGGGGGGAAIGVIGGALGSIALGLGAAGLALVGSYLLGRSIFRAVVRRHTQQLQRLLDSLTEQIAGG
jgi:hypothetical protein